MAWETKLQVKLIQRVVKLEITHYNESARREIAFFMQDLSMFVLLRN
jgi:hypothetical protein